MKANIIKWDESMAARCIERSRDVSAGAAAVNYQKVGTAAEVGVSAFDRQWIEFEKALNKALNKK